MVPNERATAYTIRAQVVSVNSHWVEQRPIDIAVHLAGVEWLWRDASLVRTADGFVVATVTEKPIVEQRANAGGR